jgi:toxin-antitoxin system PIN domain toxin
MQAVETNVLVYAHRREAKEHDQAVGVVRELAEGESPWAIPWPCLYEFFSVATNRRIWGSKVSTGNQAWDQIQAWLDSPSLRLLNETEGFASILQRFVERPRVRGPVIHDARIAAICAAHGVDVLLTRDRDFQLFPEIETRDPFQ